MRRRVRLILFPDVPIDALEGDVDAPGEKAMDDGRDGTRRTVSRGRVRGTTCASTSSTTTYRRARNPSLWLRKSLSARLRTRRRCCRAIPSVPAIHGTRWPARERRTRRPRSVDRTRSVALQSSIRSRPRRLRCGVHRPDEARRAAYRRRSSYPACGVRAGAPQTSLSTTTTRACATPPSGRWPRPAPTSGRGPLVVTGCQSP